MSQLAAFEPRPLKTRHIHFGDIRPDHLPAIHVGILAHCMPLRFIGQQIDNFASDCAGVVKRNQPATILRQQLLGMPVRGGNDGFAASKGIRKCARRDLRLVKVWRHVQIGGADELFQLLGFDKPVVKDHIFLDFIFSRQPFETKAVCLTLFAKQIWMRCSEDDINQIRKLLEHFRQRVQYGFDAFVRR